MMTKLVCAACVAAASLMSVSAFADTNVAAVNDFNPEKDNAKAGTGGTVANANAIAVGPIYSAQANGKDSTALHDYNVLNSGKQGIAQHDYDYANTGDRGVSSYDTAAATGDGSVAQKGEYNINLQGNAFAEKDAQAFQNATNPVAAADHSVAMPNSPGSSVSLQTLSGTVSYNTVTFEPFLDQVQTSGAASATDQQEHGKLILKFGGNKIDNSFGYATGIVQVSQNVGANALTQQAVSVSVAGLSKQ
jgi:hypothetical protein